MGDRYWTRRQWLTIQLIQSGVHASQVHEAVSTTAIGHPEWDMEEEKTWGEWSKDEDMNP